MRGYTTPLMLTACTAGILGGSVMALGLAPGEKRPGGGERLEHLLTVRCGHTPLTDEKARKFVRVVDPEERGVKNNKVCLWEPSKAPVSFSTDRFGVAEVKASRGTTLEIHAGLVTFTLSGEAIRFPVEAVTSEVHHLDPGEKQAPPWGSERLRQVL